MSTLCLNSRSISDERYLDIGLVGSYLVFLNLRGPASDVNEKHNRLKVTFEQITETEEQAANND